MNDLYPWLEDGYDELVQLLKNSTHHAFLISAPKGFAKQNLVENVLKYYLCQNKQKKQLSCEQCQSCLLLNSSNHPDVHFINDIEDNKINPYIKIDQIRVLNNDLFKTAKISKTKVVVINPADKLNNEAANGFLKTLEEPPGNSLIFLITDKLYALPATILSRCLKIQLRMFSEDKIYCYLANQIKASQNFELAYRINNKSPLQTLKFLELGLEEKRIECFNLFENICFKKESLGSISNWSKKQKVSINEVLLWINSWVSDLCKLSINISNSEYFENSDLIDRIRSIYFNTNLKTLFRQQERLSKLISMDKTGLNGKAIIDDLLANIVMQ